MSLTRAQWEQMWKSAKALEKISDEVARTSTSKSRRIDDEVNFIKAQIESVIGQME